MKKKILIVGIFVLIFILLFALSTKFYDSPNNDARKLIDEAVLKTENLTSQDVEFKSYSSYEEFVLEVSDEKLKIDMPDDLFLVSIAPYINNTHTWVTHSFSGCVGEMNNKKFKITLIDEKGKYLYNNEEIKTGDNGFMNLWITKDKTFTVLIEHDDKNVEFSLTTNKNSPTCITTAKLI